MNIIIDEDIKTEKQVIGSLKQSWKVSLGGGENGVVSVKKEPGSKKETVNIKNGTVINIMFTYNHRGETWGLSQ